MVAPAVTPVHHEERGGPCCPHPPPPPWDLPDDLCCITSTFQHLQISGWYWGSISASEARDALLTASEGTFLVRDSSHPQYILALSAKTCCGPTSVRIQYNKGSFWLDSLTPDLPRLQSFPDVLHLIQHYINSGHSPPGQTPNEDNPQAKTQLNPVQGTVKDGGVPLTLRRPLHRPEAFPSLQHLTRLTINRNTNRPDQLPLPKPLLQYLQDYPFHI
ncbi:cytokine-inducible SH2-containing protein-like [Aulostomus maculatus]